MDVSLEFSFVGLKCILLTKRNNVQLLVLCLSECLCWNWISKGFRRSWGPCQNWYLVSTKHSWFQSLEVWFLISTLVIVFCCECGEKLQGKAYEVPSAKGQYLCQAHYEKYASKCEGCNQAIFGQFVKHGGKKFHAQCYNVDVQCARCHRPIFGEALSAIDVCLCCLNRFFHHSNHPLQSSIANVNIYWFLYFLHQKHWHPACFTCAKCNAKLPGEFQAIHGEPYCVPCATTPTLIRTGIFSILLKFIPTQNSWFTLVGAFL